MRAENKLVQNREALQLGIPSPSTCVASHRQDISSIGNPIVLKPLGLGIFTQDGVPFAIHAKLVDVSDASLDGLNAAPYLAQREVRAKRHLRIPTVNSQAWPCELDAADLPLDWRAEDRAHTSWRASINDDETAQLAIRIARTLNLGYSCQDWIVDQDDKAWLIDINPAGQWLFLPEKVGSGVTGAIADWLVS
jgi:hypothetical protein